MKQKEEREAAQEAELNRIKSEKEREIARLRQLQERAQDRQAQIDELRAKRYQEAKDRQWRMNQIVRKQNKSIQSKNKKDYCR